MGIIVDGVSGFGRAIMRGAMRYANLQRRWRIHEEMRVIHESDLHDWPACDGVIAAGIGVGMVEKMRPTCGHLIYCSGSAQPGTSPIVCLDDEAVGAMAAQHLVDGQLKHFGFYGYTGNSDLSRRRYDGFRQFLAMKGFECSDAGLGWPTSNERRSHTHHADLTEWLRRLPKPVGIMAVDDGAAHDLAASCMRASIGVPDQVALVGVNNDDLLCDSAWPPLSSVDCDYSRVGYLAAGLLDRLLKGETPSAEESWVRLAPLDVVRRQSTDILAIEDTNVAAAIRYIRDHACDPCDVSDVLRHVPVGRRWLERQFKKMLGRNPHDEIIRIRMETAKRLLLQPELTLSGIASRCGFAANQNFGRAFQNVTGTTPGAYRRAAFLGT